ncbi:MAG: leucine-rich repeat domain-containing protein [Clostridia bacterium]|nr:leucine-rich repeat domain-containing protein [Clostridia bacterium]
MSMKKFFVTLILICFSLSCFVMFPACTSTVELLYEGVEEDGEIVAYSVVGVKNVKSEFDITIPYAYNDKPVVSIEDSAFKGNELLKSIFIPGTISTIGLNAFSDCSSLACITVDENNARYMSIDGNLYSKALYNKEWITLIKYSVGKREASFSVPKGVLFIDSCSCFYAIYLTDIVIPDSVQEIGALAFASCTSLKSITIGKNVGSISIAAFAGCNSLEDVYFKGSEEEWETIHIEENNTCLKEATIHYSL